MGLLALWNDVISRDKTEARKKVFRALDVGMIERRPCLICGEKIVYPHHDDYSKPFELEWLCRKHYCLINYGH